MDTCYPGLEPETVYTGDDIPDARVGALGLRILADGRELTLYRMTFNLRLCIGPVGAMGYDLGWCFHDFAAAWEGLQAWDGQGEPDGYFKRVGG
jgi:hypothetical protein